MNNQEILESVIKQGRKIESAKPGAEDLGPLKDLPGTWESKGFGWNLIALPFSEGKFNYRLLMNQYDEKLVFSTVDKGVPNRGLDTSGLSPESETAGDQFITVLSYLQTITQIAAEDSPNSGLAGAPNLAIHEEPGLWLNMLNKQTNSLNIARLATIPHGDSVMALGKSEQHSGAPEIPKQHGLPIGVKQDLNSPYLEPYKHFTDNPFENLFTPMDVNELLERANQGVNIKSTTVLHVDTKINSGGILNIPFVVKEANATEMTSTFWIQELEETDQNGKPKLRLQYTQTVFLDFFNAPDGSGLIRWPHISINTLEKVSDETK